MCGLFSFNTGPWTLDPERTGGQEIVQNPYSWTQFANLLYVDAPATGFSYPIPLDSGAQPTVGLDPYRDAAVVAQVVVRFLDRHPTLQCNPVIVVGESYGGTRASAMLNHIFHYQDSEAGIYVDSGMQTDLNNHYSNVCPGQSTTQFGSQVLIEPLVTGEVQGDQGTDSSGCASSNPDEWQCNVSDPSTPNATPWYFSKIKIAAGNLMHYATLKTALGVDPISIAWLSFPGRLTGGYGRGNDLYAIDTSPLARLFGSTVSSPDSYFVVLNKDVQLGYGGHATSASDPIFGTYFLSELDSNGVKTFITHAEHDNAINSVGICSSFSDKRLQYIPPNPYLSLVSSCLFEGNSRSSHGSNDTSQMDIGIVKSGLTRKVRFPHYPDAGHSVSQREPDDLLADVIQWYTN
jgi:pimeloyl-ACP methyl ester carboxylesterase